MMYHVDPAALRRIRLQHGLSMRALATLSGVAYSTVKYAHTGRRRMSDVVAHKIATALGCRPEDFGRLAV